MVVAGSDDQPSLTRIEKAMRPTCTRCLRHLPTINGRCYQHLDNAFLGWRDCVSPEEIHDYTQEKQP